jgi:hypothetical protein
MPRRAATTTNTAAPKAASTTTSSGERPVPSLTTPRTRLTPLRGELPLPVMVRLSFAHAVRRGPARVDDGPADDDAPPIAVSPHPPRVMAPHVAVTSVSASQWT